MPAADGRRFAVISGGGGSANGERGRAPHPPTPSFRVETAEEGVTTESGDRSGENVLLEKDDRPTNRLLLLHYGSGCGHVYLVVSLPRSGSRGLSRTVPPETKGWGCSPFLPAPRSTFRRQKYYENRHEIPLSGGKDSFKTLTDLGFVCIICDRSPIASRENLQYNPSTQGSSIVRIEFHLKRWGSTGVHHEP
jgi:hypothetical protein